MLEPSDYEAVPINTEDYASVLIEFNNGSRGSFHVSQCFAGRKKRLSTSCPGRNARWSGTRSGERDVDRLPRKAQRGLIKDPSLLSPRARGYAHYPAVIRKRTPTA